MCDSNCGCGCNSVKIPRGPQGEKGDPGTDGIDGIPATVTLGLVNTGLPGTPVIITNSGLTPSDAIFNFTIPRGDKGETGATGSTGATGPQGNQGAKGTKGDQGNAGTISIGSTNTGLPGTNASVAASGTPSAVILDFTIPRGDPGPNGGYIYETVDGNDTAATASISNEYLRRKISNDGYEFVHFSQIAADNQFHINNLGFNQF